MRHRSCNVKNDYNNHDCHEQYYQTLNGRAPWNLSEDSNGSRVIFMKRGTEGATSASPAHNNQL